MSDSLGKAETCNLSWLVRCGCELSRMIDSKMFVVRLSDQQGERVGGGHGGVRLPCLPVGASQVIGGMS